MPLRYSIESNLVRVHVSAMVSERDFTQMLDGLAAAKALRMSALFTFAKGASLSEIDVEALNRIRSHFATLLHDAPGSPVKLAWIMGDAGSATIIQLWRALTDKDVPLGRRIKIFTREAEGLAWLNAPEE